MLLMRSLLVRPLLSSKKTSKNANESPRPMFSMLFTCARFPILFKFPWLLRSAALRLVMLLTPWMPPRLFRLDTLEKCGQDERDGTPSNVTECCFCPMEGDPAPGPPTVPLAQRRPPERPEDWRLRVAPLLLLAAAAAMAAAAAAWACCCCWGTLAPPGLAPAACRTRSWSRAKSSMRTAWESVLIILLPNEFMDARELAGFMWGRDPMELETGNWFGLGALLGCCWSCCCWCCC
mmetsp:Transcript_27677/g.58796  ORF Transcript_27677/g.58796 Transcript_27677/m.58796 type:complete len:235 (+) Transcript_27677:1036-1740(+)